MNPAEIKKGYLENRAIFRNTKLVLCIVLLIILYTCYMVVEIPDSDEVGMYILFTHHGLIYSATQWVAPGNHVFYLVLSSIVDSITGNTLLGIRGVSYIFAVVNAILFYKLLTERITTDKSLRVIATLGYGLINGVSKYSVRGRGYTLCNFFTICSIYLVIKLISEKECKRYLIGLVVCFAFGLYTVPTFVYSIIPLVLYLLIHCFVIKDYRLLKELAISGVLTGAAVFCLYLPIFICLGLRSLYPEIQEQSFSLSVGIQAMKSFLADPLETVGVGIARYLSISSEYTGSIPISKVFNGLGNELADIACFVTYGGRITVLNILLLILSLTGIISVVKESVLARISLLYMICVVPLMIVQRVLPFYRVYLYLAVPVSIGLGYFVSFIIKRTRRIHSRTVIVMTAVFLGFQIVWSVYGLSPDRQTGRDCSAYKAVKQIDLDETKTFLMGGYMQEEYLTCELISHHMDGEYLVDRYKPDCIILSREQMEPGFDKVSDFNMLSYDDIPWEWINRNMSVYYEDEKLVGYIADRKN